MIAIIPILFVLAICYLIYDCKTYIPEQNTMFGKIEMFIILVVITVMLTGILYLVCLVVFDGVLTPNTKEVDKGGWYLKSFKPVQETHTGSKGRVYNTNTFHLVVSLSDKNMSQVISLPMEECVIKESNDTPMVEQINIVRYNKYYTLLTGLDDLRTTTRYEIRIPKDKINDFLI